MHDTIDERLAQLGGGLEAATEFRAPSLVRTRGEQIRATHRRRVMAMTATTAAVAVIGVGSLVAFRPTHGQQGPAVNPGGTGSATTSAPATTPAESEKPAAATKPIAVVDLNQHTMTVYAKQGQRQVLKTLAVSGGKPATPTHTGTFTVTAKQDHLKIESPVGPTTYNLTVHWVLQLDGGGPQVYAAPWWDSQLGTANLSHGEIGMSTDSAQWLYGYVAVGDQIQVQ